MSKKVWLSASVFFFVYKVKARGRARTQNGSERKITKGTAEKKEENANSRAEGQNRQRQTTRDVGEDEGLGRTYWVDKMDAEAPRKENKGNLGVG